MRWIFAAPPHGGTKTEGADHESTGAHKRRIICGRALILPEWTRDFFRVRHRFSHLRPQGKFPAATYAAGGSMATKESNSDLGTVRGLFFPQKLLEIYLIPPLAKIDRKIRTNLIPNYTKNFYLAGNRNLSK